MKKSKRVKKSIQSKIMATALCPLIAMSTSVSVLAINDANEMLIANVIAGILFVGVVQLLFVSRSIVKSVRKMEEYLNELAEGNLDIVIDERLSKEKDEVGSMSQSLDVLKKILKESMRNIQDISNNLIDSGAKLDQVMGGVELAADQIKTAAGKISENASTQNKDMAATSINIKEINDLIANIVVSVEHLKDTSGKMQKDDEESMKIMCNLMESNKYTNQVISRIDEQIQLTYQATVKITAVTEMITAIANQTGLLALNASIEAARAGEAGRGFSVVAEEISTLASQSSDSAKEIGGLISSLSAESKKMLEIVEEVVANARKQKADLEETQEHFIKVGEGIEDSLYEILEIRKEAEICNSKKDKIAEYIEALELMTEENVSSTKNTQQMVINLSRSISDVEAVAALLKGYSDTLDERVSYFVTERT